MKDREAEIEAVATRLDGLLDELAAAFDTLNAILPQPEGPEPPVPPDPPEADDERLVGP
jgi:hypothetical protein